MASYLEAYGAAEESHSKRLRFLKWLVAGVVAVAIVGFILYSVFQNYSEEKQVNTFVDLLKKKDYQAAYAMWGCTAAHPCRDYTLKQFMEDWGPDSPHANVAAARVGSSDTCGTGVVIPVDFPKTEPVALWVERSSKVIGFSPDPECRKKRWHFREFFHSLFNKSSLLQLNH